jgi:hypothetical protein
MPARALERRIFVRRKSTHLANAKEQVMSAVLLAVFNEYGVADRAVTVAVHPGGAIETARAAEILDDEGAVEVVGHDLANQSFEHAASRGDGYWVRHFMLDNPTGADCIYCRLFPAHKHEH